MGLCGTCLRLFCYSLVALLAVLAYFHMECTREEDEKVAPRREFSTGETDVKDYEMPFLKEGGHQAARELYIGLEYILVQWAPCALLKLLSHVGESLPREEDKDTYVRQKVTFLDARKGEPGGFHDIGFALLELDEEPATDDWITTLFQDEEADVAKFHAQIEPQIRALYPDAKRLVWGSNVVRGGDSPGNHPRAVDAPHLDYYQHDGARAEFHERWPALSLGNRSEPWLLLGRADNEESQLGVLLGLWKPLRPSSRVCDYPLAVMDARTFDADHLRPLELHMNFGFFTFHNLNGEIVSSPRQKWYYYPFQSTKEVLVFHQYSRGRFFANPHTSFHNRNCPEDTESRVSVELRVALFF